MPEDQAGNAGARIAAADPDAARDRRYRAIVESAVDFAIIATDRDGRITDWNSGAERILGWSAEEMRGERVERFFTPEDQAQGRARREMRQALEEGRASDERWHVRKDGARFWASGEMMKLRAEDGAHLGFLKILRDATAGRRAEDALREAQGLNAPVLNSSRDCIVVLDLHGNTRFVSPGGIAAMEISDVDAILGLSWLRVWTGADNAPARAAVARAREGGIGRFQGFCPTHKGTPKWWDVVISPVPGPDGRPDRLVAVGRDITELKRAEAALRDSEARFEAIANSIDQMVWSTRPDGFHDYYNQRWYEYTGVPGGSTDGQAWNGMFHPDDQARAWSTWRHSLETGQPYRIEYRLRHRSGQYRWVLGRAQPVRDAEGRVTRWFGTCTDIQDIVEAREVLARSREELEREVAERTRERDRAWRLSQDLLAVVETDGTLVNVNAAFIELLGWEPREMVGRRFMEFTHPDDLDTTFGVFVGVFEAPLTQAYEFRLRHKDGTYRWFAWTAAFEDGKVYANGRHTTAEHEQAAALAAAEEQLRQSQKMEAVGQLTGGLAHDFNNLLTGITGSLELLQTRLSQGRLGEVDRYIAAAQGAARRAAALTHRLLAFSRRQTLDPRPTDVNRLVAGLEELIRRTVGPAIEVEVVGAAGVWATRIDPNQLENALLNLCINARDAMPEGGRLTIETANKWLDDRAARERDLPPGQYLSLCVSDTGTGMTPEVVRRAFDPFFTTKPIGLGTGLGLSMVYGFARQSGGQVRIYSEPGQGTMVCLYLPRHHGEETGADLPEGPAAPPRAGQGETVLVVDDEPTVRMLAAEVLGDLGCACVEAADGAAALRMLQSEMRIDLLITDVGLPGGMNGRQVADAGRALRPGLRVLFITGYAENAVIGNGHLEPGMQVLTKPFAMETLASRIRDLIART